MEQTRHDLAELIAEGSLLLGHSNRLMARGNEAIAHSRRVIDHAERILILLEAVCTVAVAGSRWLVRDWQGGFAEVCANRHRRKSNAARREPDPRGGGYFVNSFLQPATAIGSLLSGAKRANAGRRAAAPANEISEGDAP